MDGSRKGVRNGAEQGHALARAPPLACNARILALLCRAALTASLLKSQLTCSSTAKRFGASGPFGSLSKLVWLLRLALAGWCAVEDLVLHTSPLCLVHAG